MSESEAAEREDLSGRTIADGRYHIVRRLGEGGMGTVYEARQVAMDRRVALKLIHPAIVQSQQAVARFYKEMRATSRVEHENTVRVYDFGESEGRLFLAMELLAGRTLKELLAVERRLAPERVVRIGVQVLRALSAAHQESLVHRDLKPENVMLVDRYGETDVVKVLDFGIAKSLDDERTQMTAAGALIGTPQYMSPEQAYGRVVDARSDLYSFGVLVYEMLSGRLLFERPTMAGLIVAHATEPPPPLGSLAPDVPAGLQALVMRLLEKDPAARPQSAGETSTMLAAALTGAQPAHGTAPGYAAVGPQRPASVAPPLGATVPPTLPGYAGTPPSSAGTPPDALAGTLPGAAAGTPPGVSPPGTPPSSSAPAALPPGTPSGAPLGLPTGTPPPAWPLGTAPRMAADGQGARRQRRRLVILMLTAVAGLVVGGGLWLGRPLPPSFTHEPGDEPTPPDQPQHVPRLPHQPAPPRHPPPPHDPEAGDDDDKDDDDSPDAVAAELGKLLTAAHLGRAPASCHTADTPGLGGLLTLAEGASGPGRRGMLRGLAANARLSPELAVWTADSLLQDRQLDIARNTAANAIAQCPTYAQAHATLGSIEYEAGRAAAAAQEFTAALTHDPSLDAARFNLGLAYTRLGDGRRAVAAFDELAARSPSYPHLLSARAQARALTGQLAPALKDAEAAARAEPENARAWFLVGELRHQLRRGDANAAWCQAAQLGHEEARRRCPTR